MTIILTVKDSNNLIANVDVDASFIMLHIVCLKVQLCIFKMKNNYFPLLKPFGKFFTMQV